MVFTNLVSVQPSSFARLFISVTKPSTEPETWTAMTLHASFDDTSMAQYMRSRRLSDSPGESFSGPSSSSGMPFI